MSGSSSFIRAWNRLSNIKKAKKECWIGGVTPYIPPCPQNLKTQRINKSKK
jgi:hypothetical protein